VSASDALALAANILRLTWMVPWVPYAILCVAPIANIFVVMPIMRFS
jgi:hypothetical protein